MPGMGKLRPARSFYAASGHLQKYKPCSLDLSVEMAWAAKRPANKPLTGLFSGPLTAQFYPLFLIEPPTSRYQFLKSFSTVIFLLNVVNVHKRMGLVRAEFHFWDEFPDRIPLLGKRFRAMGGPGGKKFSPCHLYDSTLLILSGILGHLRTSERNLEHLRT